MNQQRMGRHRSIRYRDLPDNLEPNPSGGRIYYRYRFPDGRRESLGSDKQAAVKAAKRLNARLAVSDDLADRALERRARPDNPDVETLIDEFTAHVINRKGYADSTRKGIDQRLNQYKGLWAGKTVRAFQTLDLSRFLNDQSIYQYVAHRQTLVDLFQFAAHQGYRDDNPARMTLEKNKKASDKERHRHTLAGYRAIHGIADDWLRRAMDVLLYSLQRREDVVMLRRDAVDLERNTITLLQRKTRNYRNPVYLDIEMGPDLRRVVEACITSSVHCPTLIHCIPKRQPARPRQSKMHPFSVTKDYLSRAFADARDRSGAYDHIAREHRPTLHELRALGIHLYRQAGFADGYIMALSGHGDERMLEHYAKDHAQPKPRLVRADLSLGEK